MMTEIPSCILSQHLWYNANIQFSQFSEKNNIFSQHFNKNGSIKRWHEIKRENDLH